MFNFHKVFLTLIHATVVAKTGILVVSLKPVPKSVEDSVGVPNRGFLVAQWI